MKNGLIFVYFLCVLFMVSCSDKSDPVISGEEGRIEFILEFRNNNDLTGNDPVLKANSTAIPVTSWANIQNVQFFLYDASGKIVYSRIAAPNPSAPTTYTYTDVPAGPYTVVAVANTKSSTNSITSYVINSAIEWDDWNVRQKNIADFYLKYKAKSFPSFADPSAVTGGSANLAFEAPAEVFMASGTVTVASGTPATVSLTLKREVSLMRLRIDPNMGPGLKNNIDFAKNNAVSIYRLPDQMKVASGNTGGVSTTSTVNHIISVSSTGALFENANPTTGYSTPIILTDNYKYWKDIVVFPNNGGRADSSPTTGNAANNRKYFVVISAWVNAGHEYADASVVPAGGAMAHWEGVIDEKFGPNTIREVNCILRTGGSPTIPPTPTEYGELTITVENPFAWDSNIDYSYLDM